MCRNPIGSVRFDACIFQFSVSVSRIVPISASGWLKCVYVYILYNVSILIHFGLSPFAATLCQMRFATSIHKFVSTFTSINTCFQYFAFSFNIAVRVQYYVKVAYKMVMSIKSARIWIHTHSHIYTNTHTNKLACNCFHAIMFHS